MASGPIIRRCAPRTVVVIGITGAVNGINIIVNGIELVVRGINTAVIGMAAAVHGIGTAVNRPAVIVTRPTVVVNSITIVVNPSEQTVHRCTGPAHPSATAVDRSPIAAGPCVGSALRALTGKGRVHHRGTEGTEKVRGSGSDWL